RKKLPDGIKSLLVLVQPREVKGVARLISEREGKTDAFFILVSPAGEIQDVRRMLDFNVRLDTALAYVDPDFLALDGEHHLNGITMHGNTEAYEVETIPSEQWFYSRLVTWISYETFLPLQRDLYDMAGRLWKRQLFEESTLVTGVPTPVSVRTIDYYDGTTVECSISDVRYEASVPDEAFSLTMLPAAVESEFWRL
ncbi:MAG TPA: outer membrane lipoprotein-sorting protein, partial [Thermodesulfobacteriota bacterium]|nr:outer membrane lipoprotein-sorting protein [Thermodesulfobacteriota bacterium]